MNLFVVLTTIYPPTAAVDRFVERLGDRVIVVGDLKTPASWSAGAAEFMSLADQTKMNARLAGALPLNHYARKTLGYLRAVERGADVIFDADDDNTPKADWGLPEFDGVYSVAAGSRGFVNAYASFTDANVWPRGFPLPLVRDPSTAIAESALTPRRVRVGVWQALADRDADVDAIFRLTSAAPFEFRRRPPIVLAAGSTCPFNSQATGTRRELFPLLYLPSTVTFRFCDILRGLVAQPIMWAAGFLLGFTEATVVQDRHVHDLLDDFESEIPAYLHAQRVSELVSAAVAPGATVAENLPRVYEALARHGIVGREELTRLHHWLADLETAFSTPVMKRSGA